MSPNFYPLSGMIALLFMSAVVLLVTILVCRNSLREKPADKDEYAQDARALFTMMTAPDEETFREGLEMMPGAAAADPFQFFRF